MLYKSWEGFCLGAQEPELFPSGAASAAAPFAPLVLLVRREPLRSRGMFAIRSLSELSEEEGLSCLLPPAQEPEQTLLGRFVRENGATVLNLAFSNALRFLQSWFRAPREGLRVTLVGLGDVGGTVLTALKLLGREISEISIFDPNEKQCARYELELNQVLPIADGTELPRVSVCPSEAELFDCDLFLFTASRGVPGLDSGVTDVRMAQLAANRPMLAHYARLARKAAFRGLFCQISDPVDHLARTVFLESNRAPEGQLDFAGLLPEQVRGFGLGVMAARAAYYAQKAQLDFSAGRLYGPHGEGLIVANRADAGYDAAVSARLTEQTLRANLAVRALGFKPYLAPGLSSAAVSILRLVRGQTHYAACALDGVYFGCRERFGAQGPELLREALAPALFARLEQTHALLRKAESPCR